jgi:hypothetical protein
VAGSPNGLPVAGDSWLQVISQAAGRLDTAAHHRRAEQPAKLRKLQDLLLIEASKYNALPLDPRQRERCDVKTAGRPDPLNGRTSMTLVPGMTRLNENTVPDAKTDRKFKRPSRP